MKRVLFCSILLIIIFSLYSCKIPFGVDEKTLKSIQNNVEMLQKAMITVGDQFPGGLDARMTRDYWIGNDAEKARAVKYWNHKLGFKPEKPLSFQVTAKFVNLDDTAGPVKVDLHFAPNISSVSEKKYIDQNTAWYHTINRVGNIERPPHKSEVRRKVEEFVDQFIRTPSMFLLPPIKGHDGFKVPNAPNSSQNDFTSINNLVKENVFFSKSCAEWQALPEPARKDKSSEWKIKCDEDLANFYDTRRKFLVESIMTVVDMQAEIPSRKCDKITEDWNGKPVCYIFMPKKMLDKQPDDFQIFISLHVAGSPDKTIGASKNGEYEVPMDDFRQSKPIQSSDSRWGGVLAHWEFNLAQVDLEYEKQLIRMVEVDKALDEWRKKFANEK